MNNTKGSILISNANAVGTALVNKLGGTGYKPSEWSDAINLLGISDDDKVSALAGITEGTYTGTERGAIKYSNCNAVGAMLNKKFSTNRGFKPVEWESAISKLTPLAEGTVSGSICNIVNGAEDVPVKNWLVTLPASLDGYSEVNAVRSGKNLFNYEDVEAFNANVIITRNDGDYTMQNNNTYAVGAFRGILFHLKPATYSLSLGEAITVPIRIYKNGAWFNNGINAGNTSCTFTVTEEADYDFSCNVAANSSLTIQKCQFEVGSTATSYEAYEAPTQYTAELGRTIYGGTADIVTGEGEATHTKYEITGTETGYYLAGTNNNGNRIDFAISGAQTPLYSGGLSNYGENKACLNSGTWTIGAWCIYNNRLYIVVPNEYTTFATALQYLVDNNATFVFPLATPTDFTFTPIQAETELGVNNFWADEGDSSITYRKDPDIPDPPVQLLNMNNNNTEENNNEGV